MEDPFSLRDRLALVTGGTRGIGRAISLQFAKAGARIVASYVRDREAAKSLEEEGARHGLKISTIRADLTNPAGMQKMMEHLSTESGKLGILVHSAATGVHRPVDQLTLRHFDWTFALNVRAFFELVTRLRPLFTPSASILAVSSEGATHAVPQYSLVGASKGALESLVRHLAAEFGSQGIRVNAISPGTVLTDSWKVLPDSEHRQASAAARSPFKRLTTLEEVATAAQFLCSNAANGVNGHTLVVDGGTRLVA